MSEDEHLEAQYEDANGGSDSGEPDADEEPRFCQAETFPSRGPSYSSGGEPPEYCDEDALPDANFCAKHWDQEF